MNTTEIQTSADNRILSRADKQRINSAKLDIALSYASVAKMENEQIAKRFGVPIYAVRQHRRLMQQRGSLGVIPGDEVPVLPPIPNTIWERLDNLAEDGRGFLRVVCDIGLDSGVASLLGGALQVAEAMTSKRGLPLALLAQTGSLIEQLNCLLDEEISLFLDEIEKPSTPKHVQRAVA